MTALPLTLLYDVTCQIFNVLEPKVPKVWIQCITHQFGFRVQYQEMKLVLFLITFHFLEIRII